MKATDWFRTREQAKEDLAAFYRAGYRYIVRDKNSVFLNCYSLKPKKYINDEGWGYANPDLPEAKPAQIIKNTDITEISWANRSAVLIEEYIDTTESAEGSEVIENSNDYHNKKRYSGRL